MALPLTRNETPAAGSEVKSATNIDLQDSVVQRAHGSIKKFFSVDNIGTAVWIQFGVTGPMGAKNPSLDIDLPVGTRITALDFIVLITGTTVIAANLIEFTKSTGATSIIESKNSSAVDGHEVVSFSTQIPYTMAADKRLVVQFGFTDNNATVYGCDVTYEKPIV